MPLAVVEVQDLGKCFLVDRVHTDVGEGLEGFWRHWRSIAIGHPEKVRSTESGDYSKIKSEIMVPVERPAKNSRRAWVNKAWVNARRYGRLAASEGWGAGFSGCLCFAKFQKASTRPAAFASKLFGAQP